MGVVPKGPTGAALNSNYQNRDSRAYKTDLGLALVRRSASPGCQRHNLP